MLASRDQERGDHVGQDSGKPGKQRQTSQNLQPDQPEIRGLTPGDWLPVEPDFLRREDVVLQDLTHTKSGLYQRRLRDLLLTNRPRPLRGLPSFERRGMAWFPRRLHSPPFKGGVAAQRPGWFVIGRE